MQSVPGCPRRLTLHHHAQNAVDARLVALSVALEPIEHILIEPNRQLLFRGQGIVAFLRKVLSSGGMSSKRRIQARQRTEPEPRTGPSGGLGLVKLDFLIGTKWG
jgi:hypothetical protein